ncbi:respiratory nitrate reductase subunit gamma [Lysobacter pythonis]|uniref:nitrate reductase (quinone) n=2 Tax=Solilutibacter pythonis TaxID=2483112 RepID=A0A3M2I053_9GAMM|nr:respiratory nitrate reductase subunit gamma [Lysobacter pythonis]
MTPITAEAAEPAIVPLFDVFVFQIYPYIALAVFLVGSWMRFDHAAYTWRAGSSQLLSGGKWHRVGSNLFHVGILAILGGHLVGLLTPHAWYAWFLQPGQKQLMAMAIGGFFGVLCLFGLLILISRRLFDTRVRATGTWRDSLLLLLLLAQLLLGMWSINISRGHMDGEQMMRLAHWAQAIVSMRPDATQYIWDAHWVFKTHVALGLTLLLITPFTRLVHVWSLPLGYLTRSYQIVRRRQRPLRYPGN